jgi:hypothetical protein
MPDISTLEWHISKIARQTGIDCCQFKNAIQILPADSILIILTNVSPLMEEMLKLIERTIREIRGEFENQEHECMHCGGGT